MYADSALSLVVPLVVIALVFITRRVTLSLFCGIVIAAVMMSDSVSASLGYIWGHISGVFYSIDESGKIELASNGLYVFGFLLILGILSQLIAYSGGVGAFVAWARGRVTSPRGSEFVAFIAGIVIFIDDYFNALSVGQMSKSLNDANGSTRERLAYIIDSTSAPICILMPLSSWGAYIIGILESRQLALESGAFLTLVASVWHNYYAWLALLVVFLSIYWQLYFPAMRTRVNVGIKIAEAGHKHSISSVWLLIAPIFLLICSVAAMLFYSGYAQSGSFNPIVMLQNTQTGFALFWGGLFALCVSVVLCLRHLETDSIVPIVRYGIGSMMPAILILICAWAIGPIINEDMQTGQYLANLAQENLAQYAGAILPVLVFVISGFIAFATGTSWGTFAIMLPIAATMAQLCGADYLLSLSAVLAGAVYGDHASPISDTTILSATGAGCNAQSHFVTQLPYVSFAALWALVGFGVASATGLVVLGWACGVCGAVGVLYICKARYALEQPIRQS
ncbi:Na+/H+ antiporter NhaC family protein [Helicobacter canis]|uniref:Na+/H+ antiporter NhaC family protein n=1 Tax=Helicobacter canis TaxID=29419 RepID=UPI0029433D14|nr:Na+/H+ antiporter NhaC family protein [Helicobacter canis]